MVCIRLYLMQYAYVWLPLKQAYTMLKSKLNATLDSTPDLFIRRCRFAQGHGHTKNEIFSRLLALEKYKIYITT